MDPQVAQTPPIPQPPPDTSQAPEKGKSKKLLFILIGVVLALILCGVAFYFLRNSEPLPAVQTTTTPSPTETVEVTPEATSTYVIPNDWKTFSSSEQGFSIQYPPDMQTNQQQDIIVMYKHGPSQSEGTEVYDGIIFNIDSGSYQENTLEEFATSQRQKSIDDPLGIEVTEMKQVSIAGRQGFEYTLSGLGTFRQIYLPKNDKEYIHFSILTEDPTGQGFEKEVSMILSTLNTSLY